jgi:transcriptional regulator of aromatic amino acid metabolism
MVHLGATNEARCREFSRELQGKGVRLYQIVTRNEGEEAVPGFEPVSLSGFLNEDYDALVLFGKDSEHVANNRLSNVVQSFYYSDKIVAAMGDSIRVLAGEVKLEEVFLTSAEKDKDFLQDNGALWVNSSVVRDKNLITAKESAKVKKFVKAFAEALRKWSVVKEFKDKKEIDKPIIIY